MQFPVIFSMQRGATTLALRQQQHKQLLLVLLPPQQISNMSNSLQQPLQSWKRSCVTAGQEGYIPRRT